MSEPLPQIEAELPIAARLAEEKEWKSPNAVLPAESPGTNTPTGSVERLAVLPPRQRRVWPFAAIAVLLLATIVLSCIAFLANVRRQAAVQVAEESRQLAEDQAENSRSDRVKLARERSRFAAELAKLLADVSAMADKAARNLEAVKQAAVEQEKKRSVELERQIALNKRERVLAFIERGAHECAMGNVDQGVATFFHAYEISPEIGPLRDEALRMMGAWEDRLGIKFVCPLPIYALAFSYDGRRFVTAGGDLYHWVGVKTVGTAQLWDSATGKLLGESQTRDGGVRVVAFSHDGRLYATGTGIMIWDDGAAHIWDAATGGPVYGRLTNSLGVMTLEFSPDDRRLVTTDWHESATLWDANAGKPIGQPLRHKQFVAGAVFSPDGG